MNAAEIIAQRIGRMKLGPSGAEWIIGLPVAKMLAWAAMDALTAAGYVIIDPTNVDDLRQAGFTQSKRRTFEVVSDDGKSYRFGIVATEYNARERAEKWVTPDYHLELHETEWWSAPAILRVVESWLAPEDPLEQLTDAEFRTFALGAGFDPGIHQDQESTS